MIEMNLFNNAVRYSKFAAWLAVSAWLVWHGYDHDTPSGWHPLPAVMCTLFGLVLAATVVVLQFRLDEPQ